MITNEQYLFLYKLEKSLIIGILMLIATIATIVKQGNMFLLNTVIRNLRYQK